jgi:hypothetical protein
MEEAKAVGGKVFSQERAGKVTLKQHRNSEDESNNFGTTLVRLLIKNT